MKAKTKYHKQDIAYLFSAFHNDRDTPDVCNGMNIHLFIEWLESQDPVEKIPEDFIMASRFLINICNPLYFYLFVKNTNKQIMYFEILN